MRNKQTRCIFLLLLLTAPMVTFAQDWEKIYTGFNYIYRGIEFPNGQSQIGFAGGQSLTYMGDGIVIKTTNGGTSWTSLWTGTDQGLEGISFPDLNTGYVCGWSQYVAKTSNGGVNWTPLTPVSPSLVYYYTDIEFKDTQHGVVAASLNAGAGLYVTADGGSTWTAATGLAGIPYAVTYLTADTYFLVTNGGQIQKSTDGGLSWTTVASGLGLLLNVNFYNPQIGIAVAEDGWIHKTYDGGVTWTPQQTAFGNPLWHGTAWKSQNEAIMCGTPETIYRTTDGGSTWFNDYPSSPMDGAMYDIICTPDDFTFISGTQGYFYRKAPLLTAVFTASSTTICSGSTVQFTDQSLGSPTGWSWIFEGGTPSTSTLQNPIVAYSASGIYDVSLTVTKLTNSNTYSSPDLIHVESPLTTGPSQPAGPVTICGSSNYDYTTTSVPQATSYSWVAEPAAAGTMTGTGLTGTLHALNTAGAFTIKVAGVNSCGTGLYSSLLNGTLNFQPVIYSLMSGGGYCNGEPGFEVQLEDSDPGVAYQLFKDGSPSGSPVTGTGNQLSFGYQTAGAYTVSASSGSCNAGMQGIAYVGLIDPPAVASIPTGPAQVCNDETTVYTAVLPANSYTLTWTLDPVSSGTLTQPSATTASVVWQTGFSGVAGLSVQGGNECGTGTSSPTLSIQVNPAPLPVVSGNNQVCRNQQVTYNCIANAGSTFLWTVSSGSIVSGQGSPEIEVLWNAAGTGLVTAEETSSAGCTGSSLSLEVTVSECTSMPDESNSEWLLYPNPVKEKLLIQAPSALTNEVGLEIRGMAGVVKTSVHPAGSTGKSLLSIDVSMLVPGIYFLKITCDKLLTEKIFIKE